MHRDVAAQSELLEVEARQIHRDPKPAWREAKNPAPEGKPQIWTAMGTSDSRSLGV